MPSQKGKKEGNNEWMKIPSKKGRKKKERRKIFRRKGKKEAVKKEKREEERKKKEKKNRMYRDLENEEEIKALFKKITFCYGLFSEICGKNMLKELKKKWSKKNKTRKKENKKRSKKKKGGKRRVWLITHYNFFKNVFWGLNLS